MDEHTADEDSGEVAGAPVHVALWPRWRDNAYLADLADGLRHFDVTVERASVRMLLARRRTTVLHIQWPDAVWSGSAKGRLARLIDVTSLWAIARLLGTPIVTTSHNRRAHDTSSTFGSKVTQWLQRSASADIVLRDADADDDDARSNRVVIPHMDWRERYRRDRHTVTSRITANSGTTPPRLVWFGLIRPYKGIEQFADQVERGEFGDLDVLILGAGARRELSGSRVTHVDRRVSDEEIVAALASADAAIFPFIEVDNSGSVIAALATDTPVIAPRVGALDDLEAEAGAEWVRLYDPPLSRSTLNRLLAIARPGGPVTLSPARSIERVAELHASLYRHLLAGAS